MVIITRTIYQTKFSASSFMKNKPQIISSCMQLWKLQSVHANNAKVHTVNYQHSNSTQELHMFKLLYSMA